MRGRIRGRRKRGLRLAHRYTLPPYYRCSHCGRYEHDAACIIGRVLAYGGEAGR